METRIVLDTAEPQKCQYCGLEIEGTMVVYGVGGSDYLRVFHAVCPPEWIAELREAAKELKKEDNDKTNKDQRAAG